MAATLRAHTVAARSASARSASSSAKPRAAVARSVSTASKSAVFGSSTELVALKKSAAAASGRRGAVRVMAAESWELKTLTTWLLDLERTEALDNEMTVTLSSIATACKQISAMVTTAGIDGITGLAGETNIQGEDQKKLDVISNDVFCGALRFTGKTGVIASEEEDKPVAVEETYSGNYVVVFDPLDGSSNIDAAVSTGSIFGIYSAAQACIPPDSEGAVLDEVEANCISNVCQTGDNLLAAGYCMYSSSCILVLTVGSGVYGFTLDPKVGEFVLTHDNIKIPESGKIYSFNEGNYDSWDDGLKKYMDSLKTGGAAGADSGAYSARYIGSLVGDFHRTMLYGGIYGYPGDAKNKNGKLRLLYECNPMSMIAEQAGGLGSTGSGRIMEVEPSEVHQRVPFFTGSKKEVEYLESFMK